MQGDQSEFAQLDLPSPAVPIHSVVTRYRIDSCQRSLDEGRRPIWHSDLTSDGLRSFEYDEANRLSAAKVLKDGEEARIRSLHNTLGQPAPPVPVHSALIGYQIHS